MTPDQLTELKNNDLLRKRLAKLMASRCFRDSQLEDLHAGTYPSSPRGDYTDVKVVTPFGEIAWGDVSRLSDDEMKALMIDVVHRSYLFLSELFASSNGDFILETL